ncbi:MAG: septal ring factor EnvC (AmiA/AmiB activator) [Lentisphaeria bacterium]|jgi:septal ring factor EnvC (AmiA/AmiB activator)
MSFKGLLCFRRESPGMQNWPSSSQPTNVSSSKGSLSLRGLSYALLALLLLMGPTSNAYAEKTDKQKQLEQLRNSIDALRKELESTKSNRDDVHKSLESTEKAVGELSKKARVIEEQLKQRREKLEQLREERSLLHKLKREQQDTVADYMNAAYRLGQQDNMRLLLNQHDSARVSRNLKYYNYFVGARAEKISGYVATIERINAIEPEIAFQSTQIEADLNKLSQQKQQLQKAQSQRKIVLAKLNTNIANQDQKLASFLEDRRQLQRLMEKVINNIDDVRLASSSTNIMKLKGKLPWPTKGKIIRSFGSSRIAGSLKWEGVLISSTEGTHVQAIHYGRIVFADYLRGHGLLMIVDHGSGVMSLYAHNQALYKQLGEWVKAGDTIASVGNSGGQKRSALYFEVRQKGEPSDPKKWLKRA